jgi:hypothetical protein
MKRPGGVTVMACFYLLVASSCLIALIPSRTFNPLQYPRAIVGSVSSLIIAVTLVIALLKMKNWSRWLAITYSALQLLGLIYRVAVAHSLITAGPVAVGNVLGALFAVWVIWYLTRPHVKTVFQSA